MRKRRRIESTAPPGKHRVGRIVLIVVCVVIAGAGILRGFLPRLVRNYVNGALDRTLLYSGKIGEIDIHLWRGAYSIHDVRISKITGDVPVPFFSAKRIDLEVQWSALRQRRVVGRIRIVQPVINFVDAPSSGRSQTGAGGPWLQVIQDLLPFRINQAVIQDGSIHFLVIGLDPPVDVYLSQLNATIDNLTNIRDETTPLISSVTANAKAMGQADLEYRMTFDPFSYRPTFKMAVRLLGLNVTRINNLAMTYGKFDFQHGWFDLVIQATASQGFVEGYVKPLFRNLRIFAPEHDFREGNLLNFFWQALIGGITEVFENQQRDQFGTLIPFSGDLTGTTTANILATLANILRNAFVRAYLPTLQTGTWSGTRLQFSPPSLAAPVSPGAGP